MLTDHRNDYNAVRVIEKPLLNSISSHSRNRHLFGELAYKLFKEEKKYLAFCVLCNKTLNNTGSKWLIAHRHVCTQKPSNPQDCIEHVINGQKYGLKSCENKISPSSVCSTEDSAKATLSAIKSSKYSAFKIKFELKQEITGPAPPSASSIYAKYSYKKKSPGPGIRDIYANLNFEFKKDGKKYSALCLFCKNLITNIATSRLMYHRDRCSINKPCETTLPKIEPHETKSGAERTRAWRERKRAKEGKITTENQTKIRTDVERDSNKISRRRGDATKVISNTATIQTESELSKKEEERRKNAERYKRFRLKQKEKNKNKIKTEKKSTIPIEERRRRSVEHTRRHRLKRKMEMEMMRAQKLLGDSDPTISGEKKSKLTSAAEYIVPSDFPDLGLVKEEFVAEDYQLNDTNIQFGNNIEGTINDFDGAYNAQSVIGIYETSNITWK